MQEPPGTTQMIWLSYRCPLLQSSKGLKKLLWPTHLMECILRVTSRRLCMISPVRRMWGTSRSATIKSPHFYRRKTLATSWISRLHVRGYYFGSKAYLSDSGAHKLFADCLEVPASFDAQFLWVSPLQSYSRNRVQCCRLSMIPGESSNIFRYQ
jgi:hypothetical protein